MSNFFTGTNIFAVNWNATFTDDEIADVAYRFTQLRRHDAYKHLAAAMKRAMKQVNAVQTLKAVCREKLNLKGTVKVEAKDAVRDDRGQFKKKWARRRRGSMFLKDIDIIYRKPRFGKDGRPMTVKVGWKYGTESKKAIWLNDGTPTIQPRRMVEATMVRIKGPALAAMKVEMLKALDAAVRDLGHAKDPKKRTKYAVGKAGGTW